MGSICPSLQSTVMEPRIISRRCFCWMVSSIPQNSLTERDNLLTSQTISVDCSLI